jgi:hypothetical protein
VYFHHLTGFGLQDKHANHCALVWLSSHIALACRSAGFISSREARPFARCLHRRMDHQTYKKPDGDYRSSGEFLRLWAITYPALEAGECAVIDPQLEKLLGKPPTPFEVVLKISLQATVEGSGALDKYAN